MSAPPTTLTVVWDQEAGLDVARLPGLEVLVRTPSGDEHRAPLGLTPLRIGSDPACDLVVDDPRVSRVHCEVALTEGGVRLRDLGSKNGVFAGAVQLTSALLPAAVPVRLGGSTLTLEVCGEERQAPLSREPRFGGALGASVAMRALFEQLARASQTDVPVVLQGETGTGKELLARALHAHSPRKDGPFVVVDCGALAGALVESDLFGHLKGSFTGALTSRVGLLEQAHGGTLFLDEVAELPMELQPRLLRALERKEVRPVGGTAYRPADARIVAATHQNLHARVNDGSFRADLYYRLCGVSVRVPPLRERKEDIPLLVEALLGGHQPPLSLRDLPPRVLDLLNAYDWPGNVRELKNTVVRLALFPGQQPLLTPPRDAGVDALPFKEARELANARFERDYVTRVLARHGGNISASAAQMGVSRQFLHRLVARYGLGNSGG